jgi:hypothetical protein
MSDAISLQKTKRKGNYKAGPGRPPGSKNKKTLEMEAATRKAVADIDGAFEGDAHAFLQAVYKNPDVPLEIRIAAAGRALRVEKPVLSAAHNRVDVFMDLGTKLEAARDRTRALAVKSDGSDLIIDIGPKRQLA